MKAMRLYQPIGVDGLVYEEVADAAPAFGDVLVKVHAAGITPTELDWPLWTDRGGHRREYIVPALQNDLAIAYQEGVGGELVGVVGGVGGPDEIRVVTIHDLHVVVVGRTGLSVRRLQRLAR